MARKHRRSTQNAGELNLTAMIDVAFQLLNFFVITTKPVDVLANLDVLRPSPDARQQTQKAVVPNVIKVQIFADGFLLGIGGVDKRQDLKGLDYWLSKLAEKDTQQTILIVVASDAPHGSLVQVLDLCAKSGLTNLSVISGN